MSDIMDDEMDIDETVLDAPIIEGRLSSSLLSTSNTSATNDDSSTKAAPNSVTSLPFGPLSPSLDVSTDTAQQNLNDVTKHITQAIKTMLTVSHKETAESGNQQQMEVDDIGEKTNETDKTVDAEEKLSDDTDLEIIEVPSSDPLADISSAKPVEVIPPKKVVPVTATDEIVVLDDDEDENPTKRRKPYRVKTLFEVPECDIIDLVPKQKMTGNSACINYACKSGIEMQNAPGFCLTYYRVKNTETKNRKVCEECFDLALEYYDQLVDNMVKGESLLKMDIPLRDDVVDLDDSDSENEEDGAVYFDEDNVKFLRENFDTVFEEVMEKYDVTGHIDSTVEQLVADGKALKDKYQELDAMFHETRKTLDSIHYNIYSEFKVEYQHLPSLEITDVVGKPYLQQTRPVMRSTASIENQKSLAERRNLRRSKQPISYVELDDPGSSNSPVVMDTEGVNGEVVIKDVEVPADLPAKGPLVKPALKLGETYFAIKAGNVGPWVKVFLTDIVKPGTVMSNNQTAHQTMYCVSVEAKQKDGTSSRYVTGKEIAYATHPTVQLDVGTRIIAEFRDFTTVTDHKKMKKDAYYPGLIGEPLSAANRYRYLIFFDDGYSQYVHYNMVYIVYEVSKNVWDDLTNIDCRTFIKNYLQLYPERAMVMLRKDQTVRTEYNGKWWVSTVVKIDCSLVQMFLSALSRTEWIYRGSMRLNPIFKESQAASNRLQNKSRIVPRKFNSNAESEPYVQYIRNESQAAVTEDAPPPPVRSVAKKSTAKPAPPVNTSTQSSVAVPFLPMANNAVQHTPPPSKVVYFTPRVQKNAKTIIKVHKCSKKCRDFITYDVSKLKGYNPLAKPMLCGWNRVSARHKGKRYIKYKAPCGRFLRDIAELHKYLRDTESEMTVDLFDFDFWVQCLAEFVLERHSYVNKDLSRGLENVAIPVVNYVDSDDLNFCNYAIKREPMEGVNLNLDPEFLCGCNCDDDCQDKSKCECWKLTLEGLKFLPKNTPLETVGYIYRRLEEPVVTGIYECNSRCKCSKTCLNRVVQNPLQLKLQVFKTSNRGWGIRCLNDIPQGTFICIYAGSMLNEKMANEGGMNYGDEYLAELDYIEVVEKTKEDYEEEAYEEDEDDTKESKSPDVSAGSGDEEDEEERIEYATRSKKKNYSEDRDFVPSILVSNGNENSVYKTRLRRRAKEEQGTKAAEPKSKERSKSTSDNHRGEDDTVTISDDEDAIREPSSFNPKESSNLDDADLKYPSVRTLFGKDEDVYIMDAKVTGNIGRFLNHSCSPNVFVQNVFVDTHDPRFPWVAFFALTYIRAGTELTWNYNYDVGSVADKVMYCYCSSHECRGRLL